MSAGKAAPVAIIGMAARVPGAEDADAFWRLLAEGRCTSSPAIPGRLHDYRADLGGTPDPVVSLLPDVGDFEPGLFQITPRMAVWMDPQQRLMLEATWHALESAGLAPDSLAGRDVGVFVSTTSSDMRDRAADRHLVDRYSAIGLLLTFASARISHQFDLRGPSITLDTACAGGLTAVAQAVSGLRAGELDMAIAGSPNIYLHGHMQAVMHRFGALSPTGQARCFSADADGYIRGEGVFCFVLKRLEDAVADGDPVLAVIRGSALNHDGRRGTLTRSDAESQVQLMTRALAQADLPPSALGYMESHAAGTGKGDPIEVQAVVELLRSQEGRTTAAGPDGKLWMGSVKGNIGHLEGAAGAASLAKAVQVLRYRTIPLTAGFTTPHPDIPVDRGPVDIAARAVPWPDGPARRVGITALGVGGANAHIVLEEAPELDSSGWRRSGRWPVPVSARTERSLRRLVTELADLLPHGRQDPSGGPGLAPPDFTAAVWTLQTGRAQLAQRVVILAGDADEFAVAAGAFVRGEPHPLVLHTTFDPADPTTADRHVPEPDLQGAARWLAGERVEWADLWPAGQRPRRVPLSAYPFDRTTCWHESFGPLVTAGSDAT